MLELVMKTSGWDALTVAHPAITGWHLELTVRGQLGPDSESPASGYDPDSIIAACSLNLACSIRDTDGTNRYIEPEIERFLSVGEEVIVKVREAEGSAAASFPLSPETPKKLEAARSLILSRQSPLGLNLRVNETPKIVAGCSTLRELTFVLSGIHLQDPDRTKIQYSVSGASPGSKLNELYYHAWLIDEPLAIGETISVGLVDCRSFTNALKSEKLEIPLDGLPARIE